jgi:Ni,Fe-hydrogenase III large subunit/Ni,Fe-hydrogenase III component G
MKAAELGLAIVALPGVMPVWRATVDAQQWRDTALRLRERGRRLVALWGSDEQPRGSGFAVHVALTVRDGLLWMTLPIPVQPAEFPDLARIFPSADRMQRATFDLLGIRAADAQDQRRWLRHGAWPKGTYPLRKSFDGARVLGVEQDQYAFVPVAGEGAHEIPVGPVHAGIIEPGHFRFSVVGERVLRLEERLGYKHKGIEKRFEAMTVHDGHRLAGRVSGDSTVAYACAYAMAAEAACGSSVPPRAQWLRGLFLERERIANHLGDLGFLANDAGLAMGLAQLSRLKERVLRTNAELFGHRYLMDAVVPGGVASDVGSEGLVALRAEGEMLRAEVGEIQTIFEEHAGLQDRFIGAGRVLPELARELGLTGLAGRASGQAWDLRAQLPYPPYDQLNVRTATHQAGDVAARVTVRFQELLGSLDLCSVILARLPVGNVATLFPTPPEGAAGIGWVEGWRGEVLVSIDVGPNGTLHRVHAHDPSWHNWPVLEHAIIGNIVPDFPLINKSFNLSYSGVDL